MKEKLEKNYIVITQKKYNGDTLFILLSKSTQSYLGSVAIDFEQGIVYGTDFRNMTTIELRQLLDILEEIEK